ncbi:NlpC/P60 family protein [Paludisphaera sp.]|uniref:NlpC/P60 family protein n=1 Tax=Paludisphaera sp. TaxID=2017432 RepID=UPI00301DDC66
MASPDHRLSRRALLGAAASIAVGSEFAGGRSARARTFAAPSGHGVEFTWPTEELIGDLLTTWRGDPRESACVPHGEWASEEVRRRYGAWGPAPRRYPVAEAAEGRPAEWLRERAIAVGLRYVGHAYQHHHVPDWEPAPGWPWKETCAGDNGKGVDCSNFTGFVYNQGFGIRMSTDVRRQAERPEAAIGVEGRSRRLTRVELPAEHEARVRALRTGDLLFIRGRPGGDVTHVVMWIGPIGRSESGLPLVLDSHGAGVMDDEGRPIPCGVQLRPFRERSWYARCASHAHRVIEG